MIYYIDNTVLAGPKPWQVGVAEKMATEQPALQ